MGVLTGVISNCPENLVVGYQQSPKGGRLSVLL